MPLHVPSAPAASTSVAQMPVVSAESLFAGPGEMRARCRAFDWSATPLGPVSGWSQSLRTTVGIVLGSRNPMFLWWGPELIQIYNDAYRPSFGVEGRHPQALGMRGGECWTDIWDVIGPQIEQVMTKGESTWHEDQYLPIERNGRLDDVWWTYSYSPVLDDDGSIGGTLVVCLETTARLRAEQAREDALAETAAASAALRASDARYRDLFTSLEAGFCVIEMLFDTEDRAVDYRFVEANPAFERQTGLVNAVGHTARELVPTLEPHWFEIYGEVARTGVAMQFENGSEPMGRWFDVTAFRVGEPSERRVAIFFTDITDAKRAARERERLLAALEVERERLSYVFRQAPSFLSVLRGPDQVFELANDAFYQLVGQRELLGKPLLEALPEVREQGFPELIKRVVATGEPFIGNEVPVRLVRTPGAEAEQRYADFVYKPLIEADGTISGVVAHGTDVTEQVTARRDIERLLAESERTRADAEAARAEAEEASRSKSDFLAVMSHELRTPLNAIGGYAELIEMGIRGPVTEAQREDLLRIRSSQRHLLGLINEVLNYTRLETGSVQYAIMSVPVREAIAQAEALVAPQARAKGIALRVMLSEPDMEVAADSEKLRQVLVNVASNAVKFTGRGGEITLACLRAEDRVRIIIRDSGIGIPADRLDDIFEPFVQVRSDLTRTAEGTGLGLAISRDLARGMGGDLSVESTEGVGSTFTLELPASASGL